MKGILMDKYIVVTTYCDKKEIADKIINTLLEKRLVAGAHISTVNSSFWWNNKIEKTDEYKLDFRTKENKFSSIENEIKQIHDYEVAEISYYELKGANKEILDWIDKNIIYKY